MNHHNTFETRQRAAELLQEAMRIWQRSDRSEDLEGLSTDPVFKLLLNALAYMSNELESDIDSLKEDIFEEFEGMMSRGEGVKATPALTVITAPPIAGVSDVTIDSSDEFYITGDNGNRFSFTPLFKTRAINASVQRVIRLDARRWGVTLSFPETVNNLSGFAFALPFYRFLGLKVLFADSEEELPILSPYDYASYPMAEFFSLETIIYNRAQAVNTGGVRSGMSPYSSYLAVDLFAGSLLDYYIVCEMEDFEPVRKLNLIFEFSGIPETFSFSAKDLKLNPVILINARCLSVNLSTDNPIEKLSDSVNQNGEVHFLHLLPPAEDNSIAPVPIQVRRIGMDRFNEGRLVRLLQNLIVKYSSDYYAFQSIGTKTTDATIVQIQKNLSSLIHSVKDKMGIVMPGTYIYLDFHKMGYKFFRQAMQDKVSSLKVSYICTDGSSVNGTLTRDAKFSGPQWLDIGKVSQLIDPVPGLDEILNKREELELSKYYLMTEDRIVTTYDVRVFCYKELLVRYGVVREMVKSITVMRKEMLEGAYRTYEALVTITIKSNEFTERAFKGQTESIQSFLSRMIWARSNGVYPLTVKLILS